jgi:hypothetical protein
MPKMDDSILKNLRGVEVAHSQRYIGEERLEVSVLRERSVFDEFVQGAYDVMNTRWGMYHVDTVFPVTPDAFNRYAITAVCARVMRTRNERFHVRCDDAWTLPAVLASLLAGIGRVTLEAPVLALVPAIDKGIIAEALPYDDWATISRILRGVENDPNCKFVFAHAIAGDKEGDAALMSLIPITDEAGRLVELRQQYEIHPIAAAAYLILGLYPEGMGNEVLPVYPLLRSPHYIRIAGVRAFLNRFYDSIAS